MNVIGHGIKICQFPIFNAEWLNLTAVVLNFYFPTQNEHYEK